MQKIQIIVTCQACCGRTYLISKADGSSHTVCQPCYACQGSGTQVEWLDLREFAHLLKAISTENSRNPSKSVQNGPKQSKTVQNPRSSNDYQLNNQA